MNPDRAIQTFLDDWFRQQLDAAGADFSAEPLSYDGNSEYDRLCYSLVAEAERLCRLRFGRAPCGCQLQRSLAGAEFSRARAARQKQRGWKRWLRRVVQRRK